MKRFVTIVVVCFIQINPILGINDRPCTVPTGFGIDFTTSMQRPGKYKKETAYPALYWQLAEKFYTSHVVDHYEYSDEPRIPKIIHQIWLGSPLPERCKKLQKSWLHHHPDWKYILWTEKEIQQFGLTNQELYKAATNYGEMSDIARYEILYRMGGLYIDTDFECLHSFNVLHHCCDFYAGLNCGPYFEVFNGLMACCPGHPIVKLCIEKLGTPQKLKERKMGAIEIINRTGPGFLTKCIQEYLPHCSDKTVLFPTGYFYPWPHFERFKKNMKSRIQPESFAVHYWAVSWYTQ